ncbi:hypothetical protein D3C77_661510 [compost metagenome]
MHVAQVTELPDHLGAFVRRADRVVQRDQTTSPVGVHKEGVIIGVEQQCFVAGQCQAAIRLVRGLQNSTGAL